MEDLYEREVGSRSVKACFLRFSAPVSGVDLDDKCVPETRHEDPETIPRAILGIYSFLIGIFASPTAPPGRQPRNTLEPRPPELAPRCARALHAIPRPTEARACFLLCKVYAYLPLPACMGLWYLWYTKNGVVPG